MKMLKNMCPSIKAGVYTSILATTEMLLSNLKVSISVSVY